MRKIMKLYLIVLSFVMFLVPAISIYAASNAKTLGDLKNELANLKNQKTSNQQKKNQTQSEINSTKNSISSKQNQIIENQETIAKAIEESERLTIEIAEGKEDLNNLLESYQLIKSDNIYLEYIFEATSYEDLIYRYALIEQIMDYETEQIDSWVEKIDYNTKLKSDLEQKEIELNNQIGSLNKDIVSLGNKINELDEMYQDISAEIVSVQNSINYYQSIGCKDNETLEQCLKVAGDTIFRKPLKKGVITSSFGYRVHPITGATKSFHSGTDIGVSEGSNVYSTANGTVSMITKKSSCGGNMVYVQHMINGKKYTTTYMHLKTINVKVGDRVTSETVVGLSGGRSYGYDKCTTGPHLHFSIATGWYGKDYLTYSQWRSHLVDPKKTVPLPNSWSSR